MGNLLRLLTREEPPEPEVFVDFESNFYFQHNYKIFVNQFENFDKLSLF